MKTGRMVTVGLVATVLVLQVSVAGAQSGRGGRPDGPPPSMHREAGGPGGGGRGLKMPDRKALEAAGVADEQIKALEKIAYEHRLVDIDASAATEKAELQLRYLLDSGGAEDSVVMEAAEQVARARGELFKQQTAAKLKVRSVLGEDVLRKLREQRGQRVPAGDLGRGDARRLPLGESTSGGRGRAASKDAVPPRQTRD